MYWDPAEDTGATFSCWRDTSKCQWPQCCSASDPRGAVPVVTAPQGWTSIVPAHSAKPGASSEPLALLHAQSCPCRDTHTVPPTSIIPRFPRLWLILAVPSPASPSWGAHTSLLGLWATRGFAIRGSHWFVISLVILFSNIPEEKRDDCSHLSKSSVQVALAKPGINTPIPLSLLCSCPRLGPEQRAIRADNELQRSSGDPDQGSATLRGQESRNTSEKMTHSSGENDAAAPALGSFRTNSIPPSLCCTYVKAG